MFARFPIKEFEESKRLNIFWSDYICFAEIVRGRNNLSKRTIRKSFDQLVDKSNYSKEDKAQIINFLFQLSKNTS